MICANKFTLWFGFRNVSSIEAPSIWPASPSFTSQRRRVTWYSRSSGTPTAYRLHGTISMRQIDMLISCTGSLTKSTHCQFFDLCFSNHYTKVSATFPLRQPRFYYWSSRDFISNLCIQCGIVKRLLIVLGLTLDKLAMRAVSDPLLAQALSAR